MAGSYKHIVNRENKFLEDMGEDLLLDNLGDAYEALEECYDMIEYLSGGDKTKIARANFAHLQKRYPHCREKKFTEKFAEDYWGVE